MRLRLPSTGIQLGSGIHLRADGRSSMMPQTLVFTVRRSNPLPSGNTAMIPDVHERCRAVADPSNVSMLRLSSAESSSLC